MSTLWNSSFAIPKSNQFLLSNQRQWVQYNAQGLNYPIGWPLHCHSHYRHQPATAIASLDSKPSSGRDEKASPSTSRKDAKSPPPIVGASERAKSRRQEPKSGQTKALLAVNKALPPPPRKRSARNTSKPQQVQPKELTHFVLESPTTFSVVSASALKRERPSVWRHDYLPPSASWLKRRLVAVRTMLTDESTYLSPRHTLNSLLRAPSPPPSTYFFDLRCNPFAYLLHLPHSRGPVNHLHLLQVATTPPSYEEHLWHPRLPWTITVHSIHTNGVLISDVLGGIYSQLMLPIGSQDYYNQDMTAEDRERIETTYKVRCNGDIGLLRVGILRIDFLGSDVGFVGLSRSWNGKWEIRTVDINQAEMES